MFHFTCQIVGAIVSVVLDRLLVTLEITPPARPLPAVLLRRAGCLGERCRRINVIHRPDRWDSLDASVRLAGAGFDPVWHLPNRGTSLAEIEARIDVAAAAGIRRVLCVRGEYKGEDGDDTPRIREVVRSLRLRLPEARVAVTLNPFAATRPSQRRRVLANLQAKLEAGAGAVQTQVSFDLESLRPWAEELKAQRPRLEIVPMLMPVESVHTALRVARRLGVPLPATLVARLDRLGADAGWEHFESFAHAVAASPLYDGLAVMTPIDPSPAFAARLRRLFGGGRAKAQA